MDDLDTPDLFLRARSAIVDAHRLSTTLQQITQPLLAADEHDVVGSHGLASADGHATPTTWTTTTSAEALDVPVASHQYGSAQSTVRKLVTVAQRLSHLRDEHESTLCHLMDLRLQQVQLRRQQLSALHALLSQQLARLGAPLEAPLARTVCCVNVCGLPCDQPCLDAYLPGAVTAFIRLVIAASASKPLSTIAPSSWLRVFLCLTSLHV